MGVLESQHLGRWWGRKDNEEFALGMQALPFTSSGFMHLGI